jgi:hypothetical protein
MTEILRFEFLLLGCLRTISYNLHLLVVVVSGWWWFIVVVVGGN